MRPRSRLIAARARLRALSRAVVSAFAGARWKARVLWAAVVPPRFTLVAGRPRADAIPVVLCLWRRPARLRTIVEQLAAQQSERPIRLVLWNNDRANDARYAETLAELGAGGAISSIEYRSSRANLGGIARFVAVRHVLDSRAGAPFVMLDDDQNVSPSFIDDLLVRFAPRRYAGVWAYRTGESYWDRLPLADGERADYVGTGGSVCDAQITSRLRFFWELPARYGFIEDLWASFYAHRLGWSLRKADTPVEFEDDAGNIYHQLIAQKDEFHRYLKRRGASDGPRRRRLRRSGVS